MSPNSHCAGADRISTAGWAVLSGSIDHACGKLASGPLNTCHETVEPRLYRRGSDRSKPDVGLTSGPSVQLHGGTAIIGRYGTPRRITGLPAGHHSLLACLSKPHKHWLDWSKLECRALCRQAFIHAPVFAAACAVPWRKKWLTRNRPCSVLHTCWILPIG